VSRDGGHDAQDGFVYDTAFADLRLDHFFASDCVGIVGHGIWETLDVYLRHAVAPRGLRGGTKTLS
jgi:hypothetical protein